MVNAVESTGSSQGQNIRRLFNHTQDRSVPSRVVADRTQLSFREKTALAAIKHCFAAPADSFANLSRSRVGRLNDPESDPFGAARADTRHAMKLPDQFLQRWRIFYFAHGR